MDGATLNKLGVMDKSEETIPLNYWNLFWLFIIGSFLGLAIEVAYHFVMYGGYESRAGLVWGPFSPIYGVGAVVLTLLMNRLSHVPVATVFFVAMLSGSAVEYATSWGLETFFGAVAWDYSGTFLNIHGRVNFYFGVMWGCLGVIWMKAVMPGIAKCVEMIDWNATSIKLITIIFTVFMVLNVAITLQAFDRENDRMAGLPPVSAIDHFYDSQFPSEWMQSRFHMTIGAKH